MKLPKMVKAKPFVYNPMLMPWTTDNVIEHQVKAKKNIIYGARALNAQLPRTLYRKTKDYDIWSKRPAQMADNLQEQLDDVVRYDGYYDEAWKSKSGKQVYSVIERDTGEVIADFTKTPTGTKYTLVSGIRYQTLKNAKLHYRQILADPLLQKRWSKAKYDLWRIEHFERHLMEGQKVFNLNNYPIRIRRR